MKKVRGFASSFGNSVLRVMRKDLPSEEHKLAWERFEIFLGYRCNFTYLSKVVYTIMFMILGKANYQKSAEYVRKGGEHDEDFYESWYSFLQAMLIVMTFGRIILMGLSYKYPRICRSYIYYQVIYLSLEWCLPRDYGDMEFNVLSSDNVMNFALLYYDFWPSVVASAAPSVFQSMMSVKHYGTPADASLYMSSIAGTVWQFFNFFMLHFVITSVGLLFVWAELMRGGNE